MFGLVVAARVILRSWTHRTVGNPLLCHTHVSVQAIPGMWGYASRLAALGMFFFLCFKATQGAVFGGQPAAFPGMKAKNNFWGKVCFVIYSDRKKQTEIEHLYNQEMKM